MGSRGPIPKRSDQRHGHRSQADVAKVEKISLPSLEIEAPEPNSGWHLIARAWFESLDDSGQSRWYEPSDWATAVLIAESMSRDLLPQVVGVTDRGDVVRDTIPLKGASLSAYLRAFSTLLVTEGDRRRLQIELSRRTGGDPDEERAEATVTALRDRLTNQPPPEGA